MPTEVANVRVCRACGGEKPLSAFPRYSAGGYTGHRHECRSCNQARWGEVRKRHKSRYYHENTNGYRDKSLAGTAHKRAQRSERRRQKDRVRDLEYAHRRDPKKRRAREIATYALHIGILIRQPCGTCGADAEAHHDDYEKALSVIWLCRPHHGERHRLINRGLIP